MVKIVPLEGGGVETKKNSGGGYPSQLFTLAHVCTKKSDLQIPQGEAPGTADDTAQAALGINLFANRQCGRYLAIADAATASATVCSKYSD